MAQLGLQVGCISSLNWKSLFETLPCSLSRSSTSEAYTWIIGDALVTIINVSGNSANSYFSLQLVSCVDSIINLISGVTDTKGGCQKRFSGFCPLRG